MNRFPPVLAATLVFAGAALAEIQPSRSADVPSYRRADLPVEQRIVDLLGRMTFAEKTDQLHQYGMPDSNLNNLANHADEIQPTYGSYIIGGPWDTMLAIRNGIQHRAVSESRLGIPALFGADVIHGYRAITPIPLAQACTWNPALV